eukprot:460919_1
MAETNLEKQLVYRLLSHELWRYLPDHSHAFEFKSCSDYIKHILHAQCERITSVIFYPKGYETFNFLFKYDNGWINLKLLLTVFPNIKEIQLYAMDEDDLKSFLSVVCEDILQFEHGIRHHSLSMISIIINSKYAQTAGNCIQQHVQKLNGVSWVMMITANAGDLLQKLYNFDAIFKTIDESSPEVTEYHCQKFTPRLNKLGLNGQFQQALQDKQIHSKSSIIHIQKMTQEEWNAGIMNGLKLGLKLKALYNSTGNIRK